MVRRPECDKGCQKYWLEYFAGQQASAQVASHYFEADLKRTRAELEAVRETLTVMEKVAQDYKTALDRSEVVESAYKELFRRTIGLHDDRYRDE
jgi:hypothetical protein